MKTIIAGSRNITDRKVLVEAIISAKFSGIKITEVVSGGAKGVDALGERYAKALSIPCKVFPADWNQYRNAAGPIRNRQMAEYADALIAIWDGHSRGTKNMIEEAKKRNLLVHIHLVGTGPEKNPEDH